jgi:hypothetical protein
VTERDENAAIWPNVTEAEQRLRRIVKTALEKFYGENWETETRKLFDDGKLDMVDAFQRNNERNYAARNQNLLQSLSILDLADLAEHFWNDGVKQQFPENADKNEWREKIRAIYNARNPITHSNPEFLSPDQISTVNRYCDEIRAFAE